MAVKANGAKLEWTAYEYGVKQDDGHVVRVSSPEEAKKMIRNFGGSPVFRAAYVTEWWDAL